MTRNFTIANPDSPITFGQSRAIRMMAGNPAYYADRETKTLTAFADAVADLTKGEAHAILESQELPASLVALAGKAATKVAPKNTKIAKGKAAAKHVAETPAATKPKAAPAATKASPSDDQRLFSIQSSIEGIRETQEKQSESLKGITVKLEGIDKKIASVNTAIADTGTLLQGFALMIEQLQPKPRTPRKPKAA